MAEEETITITVKEYKRLKDTLRWVKCLEEAGVDNWEGMDDAIEIEERRMAEEGGNHE